MPTAVDAFPFRLEMVAHRTNCFRALFSLPLNLDLDITLVIYKNINRRLVNQLDIGRDLGRYGYTYKIT